MERDVDLIRQLLLDIEQAGAAAPVDNMRRDVRRDNDERVVYHVRLLIDAGFLQEAGQTSAGSPCVRLTHAGSEFIELTRNELRWREAKASVRAATGGIPISALKLVLEKWAWRAVVCNERRRSRGLPRPARRYVERTKFEVPEMWLDDDTFDHDTVWDDDQARLIRTRPVARRQTPILTGWEADLYNDLAIELADRLTGKPLPDHLI